MLIESLKLNGDLKPLHAQKYYSLFQIIIYSSKLIVI